MEYEIARRTPRYYFVVDVEVTEAQSGIQIKTRTKMLGQFGCGVDTSSPFQKGSRVKVRLFHRGAEVNALAMVVYARSDLGMGIAFTDIERQSERVLELWIAELMSTHVQHV
jgi:PilZ domain